MQRFSSRDTALMLTPVVVLGAFGYLLSARKPAVITPTGPFAPYISRIQVLPASPVEVFDGYDTRLLVEFDAHGREPAWWNNGFSGYSSQNRGKLVRVKNKHTTSLGQQGYGSTPHLDSKTKRWICIYNLKLREIPSTVGQIRFHDTVEFSNNSTNKKFAKLWLDASLRANGVVTKIPPVSRVPAVKLEHLSLDPTPPIESPDGSRLCRAKWTILKNIPLNGAQSDTESVYVRAAVVNRKGDQVGSWRTSSSGSQDMDTMGVSSGQQQSDPRRTFTREDYSLDSNDLSPSEPLWLKGSIRYGDKWPLAVKIPIRDATGKMLSSARAPQVPFHVVSITKVRPNPDETAEGADSTVTVVLKTWNPTADTQKWQWEANYSQHIVNAFGGKFWDFPFKGGKRAINLSYSWSADTTRITIRYPLALKSIAKAEGKLVFHADIAANRSRYVPINLTVRP